jgi:YegS/Rv2252/BmrU family lipid kinase
MKKCVFIYNPESGKKFIMKNPFKNYEKILYKYGYSVQIIETKAAGDASRLIENLDEVDLVICAGGDGTINEAFNGNLKRKKKLLLGIIPIGTMNDIASMFGYVKNPDKNLEMMLSGTEKNIDVCLINDRPFVYVACIGRFVDISYATPRNLKKNYGKIGYLIYALKEINKNLDFYDITYKVDGVEYIGKYSFIFITNSTRVAGVNDIYPDVKLDDNMFEVALCNIKDKKEIAQAFQMLLTKNSSSIPGITFYRTNKFEIEFDEDLENSWCIDGEEHVTDVNKFVFTVNKSMNMLLPTRNINKLFEEK